jgi:hypothetical protein
MEKATDLQHNGHWRAAVWFLRAGYVGLGIAVAGLILTTSGSTRWVLAVGVIAWLAAAAGTLVEFLWARNQLAEPRPKLWPMRLMLISDTVHARKSIGQR